MIWVAGYERDCTDFLQGIGMASVTDRIGPDGVKQKTVTPPERKSVRQRKFGLDKALELGPVLKRSVFLKSRNSWIDSMSAR